MTIEDFCFNERHNDYMKCLTGYQTLDKQYDMTTDRKKPYLLTTPILGVRTFDFCNKSKARDNQKESFRKEIAGNSSCPTSFI